MRINKHNLNWLPLFAVLLTVTGGCIGSPARTASMPGLGHFFKVDEDLYRGAQPTEKGIKKLSELGVTTIVNLRAQTRSERAHQQELAETYGMRFVSLPMRMYFRPKADQIAEFLQTLEQSDGAVFIHCHQGEDRTGSMVAVYRVVEQGWSPENAYDEALELGMAPWNPFMKSLILNEASEYTSITP